MMGSKSKEFTMRNRNLAFSLVLVSTLPLLLPSTAQSAQIPNVREERPRLFFRAKAWDGGLSLEKLNEWKSRPEYQAHIEDLKRRPSVQNDALLWLMTKDNAALKRVLDGYTVKRKGKEHKVAGMKDWTPPKGRVDSPSYTGIDLTARAMVYDWLHDHPDFKDHRGNAIKYLEWWGDWYRKYLSPGVVPFYSRNSGALAGLTAIALALHGDSDKAPGYLAHARKYLMENMGTIREMEDGATGGGTYGYVHQFIDPAHVAAMWRSASDWDAATWIKENQGNWLERQMVWQIYSTYPPGWLWKEGDIWSSSHRDRNEHAAQIDCITYLYNNGVGRTWSNRMRKRWGKQVYYYSRAWLFFINNHPEIEPKPLSTLPRCELFSPKLHVFASWRSSWKDDATIVHFKGGENVDHHGTWDTGKFTIWKKGPLAIKGGAYAGGYKGMFHTYYKLPYSANCVIFYENRRLGHQPGMPDLDGYTSWKTWKARRDQKVGHPATGRLIRHEVTDDHAYVASDLSGATHPTKSTWIREMVFLGYRYVIVLDRTVPGKGTTTKWLLQSMEPARIDHGARVVTIDNGKAVLYSQTLLPEKVEMVETGLIDREYRGKKIKHAYTYPFRPWRKKEVLTRAFPATWFRGKKEQMVGHGRVEVIPENADEPQIYLHVLSPLDKGAPMPKASCERKGETVIVKVDGLSYTFKPVQGNQSP
jgi:hypothetical protein